jgi:DMSO/TMAO reductase YedYZ molybdopterin-dependent catalytic subunit
MAISLSLVAGTIAGALLFLLLGPSGRDRAPLAGLLLGAAAGAAALLIRHALGRGAAGTSAVGSPWTFALFLCWGGGLGWAYRRLTRADGWAAPSVAGESASAVERLDRRRFVVRLGGAAATVTVVGATLGALAGASRRRGAAGGRGRVWSADNPLPNAGAAIEPAPGTRRELTPLEDHYRIDINTTVPAVDEASWRLRVGGLVERPLELTLSQIRSYEPLHQFVTLACISNPVGGSLIGTTRWTGASLQRVLSDLALKPTATHLKLSSADGFYEVVALEAVRADERVMLAYDWDGVPLEPKHGFPLRIYVPDLYGMKQPKWIVSIEALDHWEEGYWIERGWDRTARMQATSVIDTIAVNMMLTQANEKTRIPIGGIAHAGARGISRVEVRVDDGPWSEAQLRAPLSPTTWVLWRYDWPFQKGNHTFTVRCFDGQGAAQIVEPAPPAPSGATGLFSKSMKI